MIYRCTPLDSHLQYHSSDLPLKVKSLFSPPYFTHFNLHILTKLTSTFYAVLLSLMIFQVYLIISFSNMNMNRLITLFIWNCETFASKTRRYHQNMNNFIWNSRIEPFMIYSCLLNQLELLIWHNFRGILCVLWK